MAGAAMAGMRIGNGCTVYIPGRKILMEVVRVLEGCPPFYHHNMEDGLHVATGYVLVPLAGEENNVTLLEATGTTSNTKDGAEESAANALIYAAQRQFGVVMKDFNFNAMESLRKENDILRTQIMALVSGWNQSLDHLEKVQKTCQEICMDAVDDCPASSIGLAAHGAATWVEENLWAGTAAVQELTVEFEKLERISLL